MQLLFSQPLTQTRQQIHSPRVKLRVEYCIHCAGWWDGKGGEMRAQFGVVKTVPGPS